MLIVKQLIFQEVFYGYEALPHLRGTILRYI